MAEFISRKELEVRGDNTYALKEKFKGLGCEWDGIARAWIAPTMEVKELCYELLAQFSADDDIKAPYFGRCGWSDLDTEAAEAVAQGREDLDLPVLESAKPIACTPTRQDAERICGSENVLRYWRDEISDVTAEILASGEMIWNDIYDRLQDAGWMARSVSIVRDVVEHFRQHPHILAIDEVLSEPPAIAPAPVNPAEIEGSISVLMAKDGSPAAFKIQFPYDNRKINMIKWLPGAKWVAAKKYWQVPLNAKSGDRDALAMFPHFQRSPKAAEIEAAK